jgi:beta-N-acetylhexosaminidase
MNRHLVVGLRGIRLGDQEREWFSRWPPLGVILFERNTRDADQVRSLLDEVRACCGPEVWAAVDEEGGRISRMHWPPFSERLPSEAYGAMYEEDPEKAIRAVYEDARTTGHALRRLGFTHNCAPVLDVFHPLGNAVIGDRAYGRHVMAVCKLGLACIQGFHAAGIEAIGKHFPGHGRADADSHLVVPHVEASADALLSEAEPFRFAIRNGLRHIMTAHVIYSDIERKVATLSRYWLLDVLRGQFGFSGCIWSDDLGMKGAGSDVQVAASGALAAGCNVLLVCDPAHVAHLYESALMG